MRKHILATFVALLVAFSTGAADLHDVIVKGSTDRSVIVEIIDATTGAPRNDIVFNSAGIDLWYRREGAASVDITEATLAALTTAHSDGGFLLVNDGSYRLDLPDAAFATGAQYVDFGGTVTGAVVIGGRVRLVDTNVEVANMPANVVQYGGTNGTFASGRPEVNTTHAAGTAWNSGAIGANTLATDTITAAKAAADFTTEVQTGLATSATQTTISTNVSTLIEALVTLGAEQTADSGTTTTIVDAALTQATDGWFNGLGVHFTSGTLAGQNSCVTGFTAASDTLTISPAVTTAVTTHNYYLTPMGECQTGDAFARIGAAGAGLTNIDLPNQTMDISGTITTATNVTNTVNANTIQVSGDSAAADNLETAFDNTEGAVRWFAISDQGLVQSGSGTAVTIRSGAAFAADQLTCSTFAVVAGTGAGQKSTIADNDASDGLTLNTALVTALDGTSFYQIYPTACATGGGSLTASDVWTHATRTLTAFDEDTTTIDINATTLGTVTTLTNLPSIPTNWLTAAGINADAFTAAKFAADVGTEFGTATWATTVRQLTAFDEDVTTIDINATPTGAAASVVNLEQIAREDAAVLNCEVNTANFAGSTTTLACIVTDRDAGAVTLATGDLTGRELLILSGAQLYEGRFVSSTTWDGVNSELQITLSRALPATLADAVQAIIR